MAQGSEAALEQAVAAVGPVSVAVDASSFQFHFYKSGTVSLFVVWMGKLRQGCLAAGVGCLLSLVEHPAQGNRVHHPAFTRRRSNGGWLPSSPRLCSPQASSAACFAASG